MSEWQPIETAPRDDSLFLAFRRGAMRECRVMVRPDGEMWIFGGASFSRDGWPQWVPTNWMPLPPPPAEKSPD